MDTHPDVYYSNGIFMVFNEEHAMTLRRKRIVGQLIGCSPKNPHQIVTSGLPCLISHYAAGIILKDKLARFKKIILREKISVGENESRYSEKLLWLKEKAHREFVEKRVDELKKRNIEASSSRIGQLDESKMKIIVSTLPDANYSSFDIITMDELEVTSLLKLKNHKMVVYRDLYQKGFYINSGMKFGSDFLLYPDDPVRYHAQYAVRVVVSKDGLIDLSEVNYGEINALHRLCHTANKILLFAAVYTDSNKYELVKYWTLKTREYLTPNSSDTIFELIDPSLANLSEKTPALYRFKDVDGQDMDMNKSLKK